MSERPRANDTNPHVRFEGTDVQAAAILKGGAWLGAVTLVVLALMWLFANFMTRREAAAQPPPPVMGFPAGRRPPGPQLLTDEPAYLAALRADEEQVLGSYGYVDAEKGIVRIPIEEAMRIVVSRGFPTTVPPAEPVPAPRPHASAKPVAKGRP
jgi:hypothetical protein